jgi:signal transduction histidine kinase
MGLERLAGSLPSGEEDRREKYSQLIGITESLADNVRKISSDLRPDMLDDLGLVPTLQWYLNEFRTRITGIDVEFQAVGFKRRLPPLIEIVLYRIFQEGLNNVAKHSQASLVNIRLTYSYPNVIFIMKDNGRGFKPPHPRFDRAKQGIGLIGMRERAASAGGEIDIRSAPGKGTQIRVTLPVADETGDEPMEN